jgi:two-component system, cell cycle sensor histidine kinase and response regulator CckA
MGAKLVVLTGPASSRVFFLGDDAVVGRGHEATIAIEGPEISRRHARIAREGERWLLSDLGSRNGTFLNRVPVEGARPITFGDRIALGTATQLLFLRHDAEERRLQQRERLETLGQLAAGVAHDLNNVLGIVLAGMDYLASVPDRNGPEARECIDDIHQAARRAAALTPRLLSMARDAPVEHQVVDLSALCHEVAALAARTMRPVVVQSRIAPGIFAVADPVGLHQALLNLCLNARDAMPDGGFLTLELVPTSSEGVEELGLIDGSQAATIRVRDTGSGIAPEHLERVFEPFFTTKGREEGTGLGLATVRDTMRSHGGAVRVESEVGKGSIFTVDLPTLPPTPRGTVADLSAAVPMPSRPLRVVVLEEDATVQRSLLRLLRRLGTQAEAFARIGTALSQCKLQPDCLVLDAVVLQELDRRRDAIRTRLGRPHLIVLTDGAEPALDARPEVTALRKPVGFDALVRPLARVAAALVDDDTTEER